VLDERMHLYVAQQLTLGETAREIGEEIENRITPWEEAISLIYEGQIRDAKTIAGLLYYDRLRQHAGRCAGK
jgi:ADP-ribose pyrophosphatase